MNEQLTRFVLEDVPHQEVKTHPLEKLLTFAQARTVYSEPVTVGDHTIITACEVTAMLGYGYGTQPAATPNGARPHNGVAPETNGAPHETAPAPGKPGQGGGGGGTAFARPVAVINIGPEGVWVDPVVDVTKISLAAFVMAGTVARALLRVAFVPALPRARTLFRRKAVPRPGKRTARALRAVLRRPARRGSLFARFARPRRTPPLRRVIAQLRVLVPATPAARRHHA
jgi:uncharacterized spore protein YtfJ